MSLPILISSDSFQEAWLVATTKLSENHWEIWNIVTHIKNPLIFDGTFHQKMDVFSKGNNILNPKAVCYTIFPFHLYNRSIDRTSLYSNYIERFYPRTQSQLKHTNWGTYFQRMISYSTEKVNQLENIISAINNRKVDSKAAFTIIIQKPGSETIRKMGSPCLNYIAVQICTHSKTISLLATYRNHDYLNKTYGNYWGLCELLKFICTETGYNIGTVTCISSHAYVQGNKRELKNLIEDLNGIS